jgi:hypothetical protein
MSGIFDQIINYSPPLIVSGTVNYKGTWDASTNNPTLNNPPATSTKGDYYVVSVAGTQFTISFAVGDWIISSGTAWEKVDLTDAVSSVFGRTGAVVGVSTDYSSVGLTNTAIGASSPSSGAFTSLSSSSTTTLNGTTIPTSSTLLVSGGALGTPSSGTLSSCTGLPISTGVSGLGTGIATALAVNSGSTGAPALLGSAGAFTTLSASGGLTVTGNADATSTFRAIAGGGGVSQLNFVGNTGNLNAQIQYDQVAANTGQLFFGTNLAGTFATRATLTSTGLNSTAIGATTPSTGAFTTLSASGITTLTAALNTNSTITATANNIKAFVGTTGAGTGFAYGTYESNGGAQYGRVGIEGSSGGTLLSGTGAYDFIVGSISGSTWIGAGGAGIAKISGTGLAVTGALSATGALSITATAASSISRTLSVGALIASGNLSGLSFVPNSTGLSAGYNYSGGDAETNMIFGASSSSQQMRFQRWDGTTLTNVLTLVGTGNVGIGTSSPAQRLHVQSGSAASSPICTTGVTGDTVYQAILVTKFDNDSTTSQNFIQFQINNGGANCGKITANGANTAAFGSTSDKRVKENIADLPSQLANIMALRPVEFDYLESYGGGHQIGFVAQEMQQVYPDVIAEDASEEKILSITGWSKTEARLVKALQELNANLVAELQSVRQRLAALEQSN